jgi:hypothetical protein
LDAFDGEVGGFHLDFADGESGSHNFLDFGLDNSYGKERKDQIGSDEKDNNDSNS